MSIYATRWALQFPRFGEFHIDCDWVTVIAHGVPAHLGAEVPDPYAEKKVLKKLNEIWWEARWKKMSIPVAFEAQCFARKSRAAPSARANHVMASACRYGVRGTCNAGGVADGYDPKAASAPR
jgi:hypothetical protein